MSMREVIPGGTHRAAGPAGSDVVAMPQTVLIVEDNELNMKLFNDLLEAHGYATIQTKSGVEAVELARPHRLANLLLDQPVEHLTRTPSGVLHHARLPASTAEDERADDGEG